MTVERALRLTAGSVVGLSLLLGIYHSPHWFWLTGFVSLNLIQSAFTNRCPAKTLYEWMGLQSCDASKQDDQTSTPRTTA
ncbi:MAG: DUF2892 domain-containing protein [bacterium]